MIDYTLADCSSSYSACEVWAHADRLGSTVKTTDSLGNEIDTYTYSKFGESGPEGDSGFPFRFTGQRLEAATGLYYYKARWYDPETGRFLQTDPIGYGDGMNMYAYVGNDPVNATDPTGLLKTRSCIEGSCGDWQESGGGGDFGGAVAFDWGSGSGDSFGSHSGFGFGGGGGGSAPPSEKDDPCDRERADDCVVVTAPRRDTSYLDGLISTGFYFCALCLPTLDYYFDELGVTVIAKRKSELELLRERRARFATAGIVPYTFGQLQYQENLRACLVSIGVANLAGLGANSRTLFTLVQRRVLAGVGIAAVVSATINCGLANYDFS